MEGDKWVQRDSPTYEDLTIDPLLSNVERIERYATGTVELQRLVHVLLLCDTVKEFGLLISRERIFPLMLDICKDPESVIRESLTGQVALVAEFCGGLTSSEAYESIITELLPVLKILVCDENEQVRIGASASLVKMANYISDEDVMEHVLSIVLKLAHDEEDQELRIVAAGLLNGLSVRFGGDLSRQFVVPEIISLSEDPAFEVRKAVAQNMDKIFTVVSKELVVRLFHAFEKLASDALWLVRKACGECLAVIAEAAVAILGTEPIVVITEKLIKDKCKWVRGAIALRLGRLIVSLIGNESLLNRFIAISKLESEPNNCWVNKGSAEKKRLSFGSGPKASPVGEESTPAAFGSSILYWNAFDFPGVLLQMGDQYWPELAHSYKTLCCSPHAAVRKSLASSLHEFASILGPDITHRELVPALKIFLTDEDSGVKTAGITSLPKFMQVLRFGVREKCLPIMVELYHESCLASFQESRWRIREATANALPSLLPLFSIEYINAVLMPLTLQLIYDDVDAVRSTSNKIVGPMLDVFRNSEYYEPFINQIVQLSTSNRYLERQQYVVIACHLHSVQLADFETHFIEPLMGLQNDCVVNVRLKLAHCLETLVRSPSESIAARSICVLSMLSQKDDSVHEN